MKAAVYLRVSTDRQDEANQEPDCLRACEARGWEPVIYRERESAVKVRPEWQRLKDDARRGEVRAVVFYSLTRIGRRRTEIAADLADLSRWGMAIVSVREAFLDVDDSPERARFRDLLIQWWGWFAEAEREVLIDRTRKAIERIQRNLEATGQHTSQRTGRTITKFGRPGYGVRWRARALELAAQGRKPGQIAEQLRQEGAEEIGRSTIREWLARDRKDAAEIAAAAAAGDPAAAGTAGEG